MRSLTVPFLLAMSVFAAARASAQVVINEILYRPGTAFPENTAREFIELYNPSGAAVDLSGWALTSGVSYTIPAGTVMAPGSFLVIAANPAQLQATYGVAGALGPWQADASLSGRGEKIALSKPGASPGTWLTVDDVTYASEGDWAVRVRETTWGGWDWVTAANGGGASVELRNPALSNDNGQNWLPCVAGPGATPGAVNSVFTTNVPPIIHDVKHWPPVPKSSENVTVSCQITDESGVGAVTAALFWRDATTVTPGTFQSVPMTSESNGVFSATLGPRANRAIVEFYVSATDGVNVRTWPAPTSEGQNANCLFQVDDEVSNATDSYYRMILTAQENAAFDAVADSSDRVFNHTLVVARGADTTIRYRCGMRIRGNSSRNYQFRPMRIMIPTDDLWDGESVFNLNPKASYLQFIGMRLMQAAGVRAANAIPVELRRNGIESTTSSGTTPDFGKWTRIEDEGGDMVDTHWPGANGGNIYKKIDGGGSQNFYWRSSQPAPTNPNNLLDGWSKQNNSTANDWSDLRSFFQVWQAAARPHFPGSSSTDVSASTGQRLSGIGAWNGTGFTTAEITSISTVADLDQWARWFAIMTILQDLETKVSNGVDDDYAAYFVPSAGGQRRVQFIAHDVDTIFGLGDDPQAANYTGLYDMTEGGQSNFAFRALLPLFGTTTTAGNAAFRTKYHTAIRELYGSVFAADTTATANPAFYQFIDDHLAGWVPAATRTAIKNFATARQAHLLGLIGSGPIAPPAATSSATFSSAAGALMIHEILADNRTAVNLGGAFPDLIELHNQSAASIDLSGMSLTDDPAVKAKFVFPVGTTIQAGGYLVVQADSGSGGGLHTGFGLDQDGDTVQLYGSVGAGQPLLDSITFGIQAPDFSVGRGGAALETWALQTPTPGAANSAPVVLAAPASLKINEWLGNPSYQWDDDFLELHNSAAQPVTLGGMAVTNDFINFPTLRTLPPLSFIGPTAFLRMNAKGSSALPTNARELPFKIDGTTGWLALLGENGTIVDRVDLVSQAADVSAGRTPDGGVNVTTFSLPGTLASPGASNVPPPANILGLMNGLRVTEVLYTPTNLEYIELQNIGPVALDLSGVRFTKGVTYTFDQGVTLPRGAFIVVCRDRAAFTSQFGANVPLAAGTFSGSLDNAGESIGLRLPNPWEPYILNFAYESAWYTATNNGYSLVVVDAGRLPGEWGKRTTWAPSSVAFGTPGNNGPPVITGTLTAAGIVGDVFNYQIESTKFPTSYSANPLPPGLTINPGTGLISGTPNVSGNFEITIAVANPAGSDSRTLSVAIADSGPLAGFVWSSVPTSQTTGAPFPASLRATDAKGRTVNTFNGAANLSVARTGMPGATMLITEFSLAATDYFELQNVSAAPVNTAGWFVVVNNATAGANVAHTTAWALPSSVEPTQLIYSTENVLDNYFGELINWLISPGTSWIMLVDQTGQIRDFAATNYTESQIAAISVSMNGFTLAPGAQWSGAGISLTGGNSTCQRVGGSDTNVAGNWVTGTSTANRGAQNAGLLVTNVFPVAPAAATFTNGIWSGTITVPQTLTGVRLVANDGANHAGESNLFDTVQPTIPNITSPPAAITVVGQPFSFQITTDVYAGSFSATNLPATLSVNTASGLISGSVTAAGTFSVPISATNAAGTANGSLALEVQSDADADGMGDGWESAHGLNPSVNDGALDLDGDGQSNLAEWQARTPPNDPASRFQIINEQIAGGNVTLVWTSSPGRRYRVFARSALTTGDWQEITPAPIPATATSTSFSHEGGASGGQRFHRVTIEP